jgi:DNA replication protein DnaC
VNRELQRAKRAALEFTIHRGCAGMLDELRYLSFSRSAAQLLFQVFAERYERPRLLVTSNLAFSDWGRFCCSLLMDDVV